MPASRVVAIIPARGGSKGIPSKNLAEVEGRSLLRRAVDACTSCRHVDLVVVSTDDARIAEEAQAGAAQVVWRPDELASDEASSESALLHALHVLEGRDVRPDVIVFAQATSPFIDPAPMGSAVERVAGGDLDVAFSAVPTFELLWRVQPDGDDRARADPGDHTVTGINHDPSQRLRRQDRSPDWRETGAFYVMQRDGFVAAGHRFFGRIGVTPVAERDALEIDTPEQLMTARLEAAARGAPEPPGDGVTAAFARVRALVTDFDGVHTDDRVILGGDGSERVFVNRQDGHGVSLLRRAGMAVLILSTETNPVVSRRAEKLGVECVQAVDDKWSVLRDWLCVRGVDPADVAYLGNDVNDLECLRNVGLPLAVADAHPTVRRWAAYVTARPGGRGAVREIAELLTIGQAPVAAPATSRHAFPEPQGAPL